MFLFRFLLFYEPYNVMNPIGTAYASKHLMRTWVDYFSRCFDFSEHGTLVFFFSLAILRRLNEEAGALTAIFS